MKNKKKVLSLIALAIVSTLSFFFFSFKISHAQTYQQPIHSSYEYNIDFTGQQLGTGTTTTISNIAFFVNASSTINNLANVSISVCSVEQTGANSTQCPGTFYGLYQSSNISFADNFIGILNIPITATTTNPTRYYFISYGTNHPSTDALGGSINDVYPNGRCKRTAVGDNNCNTVNDLFFGYSNTPFTTNNINATGSYITNINPTNGSIIHLLDKLIVSYYANATNTNPIVACANISTTTQFNYSPYQTCVSVNNLSQSNLLTLGLNEPLPIADYYWQSFLSQTATTGATSLLATSSITTFSLTGINGVTTEGEFINSQSIASSTQNIFDTCHTNLDSRYTLDFGFTEMDFGSAFCGISKALFQPNTGVEILKNNITSFENVFPFNIPFTVLSIINTSLNTNLSSTTTAESLTLPWLNGSSVTWLTPTIIEDTFGITFKNAFFKIQELGSYAITLFLILEIIL